jgi:hypothetical protein
MYTKILILITTALLLTFLSFDTYAATAVKVELSCGPALEMDGITTLDLIVPQRHVDAPPLNLGDCVMFTVFEPSLLMGQGTIVSIYDTLDEMILQANILEPMVDYNPFEL